MSSNEGKWVWSTNDEVFRASDFFDTREEAITDARKQEDAGEVIYTGQLVDPVAFTGVNLDNVLEDIHQQVYDEVGEVAEDYLGHVNKEDYETLESDINTVIRKWMKEKSYEPMFFKVVNIEGLEL